MARGSLIVLVSHAGRKIEGTIEGDDLLPGSIMEIKPGTAEDADGRLTYRVATPGADGGFPNGPLFVLDINFLAGGTADTPYATGTRGFLWAPSEGDELNVRVSAPGTGTGDLIAAGTPLIIDNGTGNLIETTGTPDCEPFITMEAVEYPDDLESTGTLVLCQFTGI